MSDNILIFIPTDPQYTPELPAQLKAEDLLRAFAPNADEVKAQTTDEVELVTGTNLERILCRYAERFLIGNGGQMHWILHSTHQDLPICA